MDTHGWVNFGYLCFELVRLHTVNPAYRASEKIWRISIFSSPLVQLLLDGGRQIRILHGQKISHKEYHGMVISYSFLYWKSVRIFLMWYLFVVDVEVYNLWIWTFIYWFKLGCLNVNLFFLCLIVYTWKRLMYIILHSKLVFFLLLLLLAYVLI